MSHGITSKEYRNRKSGFVEIAFYSPEFIAGAGAILRAVVSRQCRGGKWCVYAADKFGVQRMKQKRLAVNAARLIAEDAHILASGKIKAARE